MVTRPNPEDWAQATSSLVEVPQLLTLEMVEAARANDERFRPEKCNEILHKSSSTLRKKLKTTSDVVRVDITASRPWQKVIAGARDKIREKLVGPGIVECHLEMDGSRMNPHTHEPHATFVLTHVDDRQVIYHPGKQKDGLLFFREANGRLHSDIPDKDDRDLAFRLAAGWHVNGRWKAGKHGEFKGKVRAFQQTSRPEGWRPEDFEIGSDVWGVVLAPRLQEDFRAMLAGRATAEDSAPGHEISLDLKEDEDGVEIKKAITQQGEELDLDEALDAILLSNLGQRAKLRTKPEEVTVRVSLLRFTQRECSSRFTDKGCFQFQGCPLEECIEALVAGKVDLKDTSWTLRVMRAENGNLYSLDNRRLYCLQQAQSLIGAQLKVKTHIYEWTENHGTYVQHFDTWNDGQEIKVRGKKQKFG